MTLQTVNGYPQVYLCDLTTKRPWIPYLSMRTTKFLFHFLYFQNFWQAAANPHGGRSRRLASAGITGLAGFNALPQFYTASGARCREMNVPQHQGSAGKVKRHPGRSQEHLAPAVEPTGPRAAAPLRRGEQTASWGEEGLTETGSAQVEMSQLLPPWHQNAFYKQCLGCFYWSSSHVHYYCYH